MGIQENKQVNQKELANKFRRLGIRLTPQRLAVTEAVINSTSHPSVQEIYDNVSERFPYITLATVYSTLSVLQKKGLVQELPFQKLSRYDANLSPHANLVCVSCDTVVDTNLGVEHINILRQTLSANSEFEIASQRVDFYGLCPACSMEKEEAGAVAD
jgi:Fur family peroxide stress response transcriptional regulator